MINNAYKIDNTYAFFTYINGDYYVIINSQQMVPIDFQSLLDVIVDQWQEQNVNLKYCNKGLNKKVVYANKKLLRRVFDNVIENAIKYGNSCQINAGIDEQWVVVSMIDQGAGVKEEHVERMFEPFVKNHALSGSGLGLAIAKRIIEGHGGQISAKNVVKDNQACGLCIKIILPIMSGS